MNVLDTKFLANMKTDATSEDTTIVSTERICLNTKIYHAQRISAGLSSL